MALWEPPAYGSKDYWLERYSKSKKSSHEWYFSAGPFLEIAAPFILEATAEESSGVHSAPVLEIGCGNSRLSEGVVKLEMTNVTAIDYASSAIELRNTDITREKSTLLRSHLRYEVADIRSTRFSDGHFSVILDKATIDAMDCDDDKEAKENVNKALLESHRLLRPGGLFIVGTCRDVNSRINSFNKMLWQLTATIPIPKASGDFTPDVQHIVVFSRK